MTLTTTANKVPYKGYFASPVVTADYERLMREMSVRLDRITQGGLRPVFSCGLGEELWFTYLVSFADAADRQYHTCNTCKAWFKRYADLCVINADGSVELALWPLAGEGLPASYLFAVERIQARFQAELSRRAFQPFFSTDRIWGVPHSNGFQHFCVVPPPGLVLSGHHSSHQRYATKMEELRSVQQFLAEHPLERLQMARDILQSGQLGRSELHLPGLDWLITQKQNDRLERPVRDRLLVLAVTTAGSGFCHPRSGMVGMLLDDLAKGLRADEVVRRYNKAMAPLAYQRPKAAPAAATIAQAEKLVAELGIGPSLERRFLGIEEVRHTIWSAPAVPTPKAEGVFGHLLLKDKPEFSSNTLLTMSWAKFRGQVLGSAASIKVVARHGAWVGLTTAVDPDAPPILKWDRPEARNPVAWYQYNRGSLPEQWGLRTGDRLPVVGITDLPCHWDQPDPRYSCTPLLLVDGAKCKENGSLALFPEILRGDLHPVRSVVEAHSNSRGLTDIPGAQAVGFEVGSYPALLEVTTASGVKTDYAIDRLD